MALNSYLSFWMFVSCMVHWIFLHKKLKYLPFKIHTFYFFYFLSIETKSLLSVLIMFFLTESKQQKQKRKKFFHRLNSLKILCNHIFTFSFTLVFYSFNNRKTKMSFWDNFLRNFCRRKFFIFFFILPPLCFIWISQHIIMLPIKYFYFV